MEPVKQLRNFIPIGGPATREPAVGDEGPLRVVLGFTPQWYVRHVSVDFGPQWHQDPIYRYESLYRMKEFLSQAFPDYAQFQLKPNARGVDPGCATISGAYGIMPVPLAYGIPAVYRSDGWPDAAPGSHLSKEVLMSLKPFEPDSNPFMQELLRQIDLTYETYGTVEGFLNYQGILNIALKVRGVEIFMDMCDDPPFAHFLLSHIADTIGKMAKTVQARQRQYGFDVDLLSLSNCVLNMISPAMYEEFVLPLDEALSHQFELFGIHICNWNITPYLDSLRKIKKMGYLDMGMDSDMEKARRYFPDTRRAVLYHPNKLIFLLEDQMEAEIRQIYRQLAPCDLVLGGIDPSTTVEQVRRFLDLAQRIREEGVCE